MSVMQIIKEKRCKKCNSSHTYFRFKKNERVCQNCGHIEKEKIEEEK